MTNYLVPLSAAAVLFAGACSAAEPPAPKQRPPGSTLGAGCAGRRTGFRRARS